MRDFTHMSRNARNWSISIRMLKVTWTWTWTPPNDRERALNTFLDAVKLDITTTKPKPTHDNLTVTERQAIGQLKQRQDIIIKPADKGSGTVVMDLVHRRMQQTTY